MKEWRYGKVARETAMNTTMTKNAAIHRKYDEIKSIEDLELMGSKTAWIIGAGPSIDKNIDYFCENYNGEDLVIATDASLKALARRSFIPDVAISIECDSQVTHPNMNTVDRLLDGVDLNLFKDVPLAMPFWGCAEVSRRWPNDEVYFFNNRDPYYDDLWQWKEFFEGDVVDLKPKVTVCGFAGIELARYLMCKEAVLLGFDMTFYDKVHHCKDYELTFNHEHTLSGKRHYEKQAKIADEADLGIFITNCTEGGICFADSVMTLEERMGR